MTFVDWLQRWLWRDASRARRRSLVRRQDDFVTLRLRRLEQRRVLAVTAVNAGVDATVVEDHVYSLDPARFTDVDLANTHTAVVNWDDGSPNSTNTSGLTLVQPTAGTDGSVSGSHTFANPGTYTVTVTVTGGDGSTRNDTLTVHVLAHFANAGGPYVVATGSTVTLNGTASDPSGTNPVQTLTWDFDNDGIFGETGGARGDETGSSPIFNSTGLAAGTVVPISFRVSDSANGVDTVSTTVTVYQPPSITTISNQMTTQGTAVGPLSLTLTAGSAALNTITLSAASSNTTLVPVSNVVFGGSGANRTVTITPAAGQWGTSSITITATDGNGLTDTTTFSFGVNNAPTLSGGPYVFTAIDEDDSASASVTVSTILAGVTYADANSSALRGIAITASVGNGTWQYSTDSGANWTDVGTVSGSAALLLRSTDLLQYIPDAENGETATLTFRGWDQTTGTFGTKVNIGSTGGTNAFSTGTANVSLTVTSLNDAPTIVNGNYALPPTDQGVTSPGVSIATILANSGYADVDTGALSGVAVVAKTGNGTWQYSTNGGVNWINFGTTTNTNALLLKSGTLVRFDPTGTVATTGTFGFRAWDQITGAEGTRVDLTSGASHGGTTAYSDQTSLVSILVQNINDAPTLSGGPVTLTGTNEETTSSGTLVSSILGDVTTDDGDGDTLGIVITATTGGGTWQYLPNGGMTWINFGAVSDSSALQLGFNNQVRYVPDGDRGETATFTFRAWDRTNPQTSGTKVNTTTNGGTTPFSSGTAIVQIIVTDVNDAPTLSGPTYNLAGTNEDTTSSATSVGILLGGQSYNDVDPGSTPGIAITTTVGNGAWQYSIDNGASWNNVGTVSGNSALLLRSIDLVRYQPDTRNGETATITYRGWDGTSGTQGTKVDSSTTGGTTAFSTGTAQASIAVSNVNDAPTLSGGPYNISTDEDTPSTGVTVSTILAGVTYDCIDTNGLDGIAITATTGNGTWQFSVNGGGAWTNFGAVSNTSALVLTGTALVRYVPDGNNGETANFTFRAWDQTNGAAQGSLVNTSVNGGTSPYSAGTAQVRVTVSNVNDAPTMATGPLFFAAVNEDTPGASAPVGLALALLGAQDVDTGTVIGAAVTATSGNGNWQYSIDNGASWVNFGAVSDTNSLLLDGATTLVRYLPDGNNGENATMSYRAWDQSTGTAGTKVNTSTRGGTTPFSLGLGQLNIAVTDVNDAPTVTGGPSILPGTNEDTISAPVSVGTMIAGVTYGDVDTGAARGVAITASSGNGFWIYSLDNGNSWNLLSGVSDSTALLLTSNALLIYIPDAANGETATLTFRGWDETGADTEGTFVDTTTNGATTPFSTGTVQANLVVAPVNDAPTLSGGPVTLPTTDENTPNTPVTVASILGSTTNGDIDNGATMGIAVTATVANGHWEYSTNGLIWTSFGTVSDSQALLLNAATLVRFVPDSNNGELATFTFRAWDHSDNGVEGTKVNTAAPNNDGTTPFSFGTVQARVFVTSINDAPIVLGGPYQFPNTNEDTTSSPIAVGTIIGGVTYTDPDIGDPQGIAITGFTGNGTWQYSLNGGGTWFNFGTVDDSNALLLDTFSVVRYIPDQLNGETASFSFRGWDQSSDFTGARVDTTNAGFATAFSLTKGSAQITVTNVNDAPTLANSPVVLTGTDEDHPSSNTSVATILTGAGYADVDTGAIAGIAITSVTGFGTWQYSTNVGVSWNDFGAVSGASSLLLTGSTLVRYLPDQQNGETASFTFRAWDRSGPEAPETKVSTATVGGTTPFSAASSQATLVVTSVNDAPTLAPGTYNLAPTNEDTISTATSVAVILAGLTSGDVDFGAAQGIAVTGANAHGVWQYSLDGGGTWTDFGTVSVTQSLLLDALALVRYTPDQLNAETATFSFRAWDQSPGFGANGAKVNTTTNGGVTAYSTGIAQASIAVNDVNDAPTINAGPFALPGTNEDTPNAGTAVSTILTALNIADVDIGAMRGLAIMGSTGNGNWQFSTDGGATWNNVGPVNSASALLLTPSARLRYAPDQHNGETATLSFRAWDQSDAGAPGTKVAIPGSGGSFAYSSTVASATVVVTSVNDAPTLTGGPVTITPTDEDHISPPMTVASILGGAVYGDVDQAALPGIAVTAVSSNGVWQYSIDAGATWSDITGVSETGALLLAGNSLVRFSPDLQNGETATFTFRAWDQTTDTVGTLCDVTTRGGTTAFSTGTAQALIVVAAVNDAPTISAVSNQLIQMNGHLNPVAFVIGDVDNGDVLSLQGFSSNPALVPNGGIVFGGAGANRTVSITPAPNQSGSTTITLAVLDLANAITVSQFTLRVNAPPVFVQTPPQLFQQSTPPISLGPVGFIVTDADVTDTVTVTATSSNHALIQDAHVIVSGTGPSRTIIVTPQPGGIGLTTITLTSDDGFGGTSTESFVVRINGAPTIVGPGNQLIQRDSPQSGPLTFTINDPDPNDVLSVTVASSVNSLIPDASIIITGAGTTRTVVFTPAPGQSGLTTISLTVSDGFGGFKTNTFNVRVNAPPALTFAQSTLVGADSSTTVTFGIGDDNTGPISVTIFWGDGSSQTFGGAGSFTIREPHIYIGPPDPKNPAAPINVQIVATDSEGGRSQTAIIVEVAGSGISTPPLAEQAPNVPIVQFRASEIVTATVINTVPIVATTFSDDRPQVREQVQESRRQITLRIVNSRGTEEPESYSQGVSAMEDMRELFGKLPDGHYRLYLTEDEHTPPRLMVDVFVLRGRAVSPGDVQADRPPTPSGRDLRKLPIAATEAPKNAATTPANKSTSPADDRSEASPPATIAPDLRPPLNNPAATDERRGAVTPAESFAR